MGYWKSKVLPKIKKVFEKNGSAKKAGAAEACKAFDESKEAIAKEFEDKKGELQPKVLEVYEASSTEVKAVVKDRKDGGLKKNGAAVQAFLDELTKIDFPGCKQVSEASNKFGPTLVSGPVFFVFEKVSTFIITEEVKEKGTTTTTTEEVVESKEKEIAVEEKKDEEVKKEEVVEEAEKKSEASEPTGPSSEPPKAVEEEAAAPKAPQPLGGGEI